MKTLKTGRKWVACLLMLGGVGGMNAQNEWIEIDKQRRSGL